MNNTPSNAQIAGMASKEWRMRPADERFPDIYQLLAHLKHRTQLTVQTDKPIGQIKAIAQGGDVLLASEVANAKLSHYSFGQLSTFANLSAKSLRDAITTWTDTDYAASWVADGINHGLEARSHMPDKAQDAQVLVQRPNGNPLPLIRCLTSDKYSRVWDQEIVERLLLPLVRDHGFINPPAMDGPAGLYAGDRDMFAFLTPANVRRLNMPTPSGLISSTDTSLGGFEIGGQMFYPFLIAKNSEVGSGSVHFVGGLLQSVCGNHLIHGLKDVVAVNLKHVGEIWPRVSEAYYKYLGAWTSAGTMEQRLLIQAAMETFVAKDILGVHEWIGGRGYSQRVAEKVTASVRTGDKQLGLISDDVSNLWNIVSALTASNREILHQDTRFEADRQASKLLTYAKPKEKALLITV